MVVGEDGTKGGLWCSPVANTSSPTFSALSAMVTMALIRSASDGVRPVVGSVVTSPTVKIPNCMLLPHSPIVQSSTTGRTRRRGEVFRSWAGRGRAPLGAGAGAVARRRVRRRQLLPCHAELAGPHPPAGGPLALLLRQRVGALDQRRGGWVVPLAGVALGRLLADDVVDGPLRDPGGSGQRPQPLGALGAGPVAQPHLQDVDPERVPDLGQLLRPAGDGLLVLLLRADEGLLDLGLVPRI